MSAGRIRAISDADEAIAGADISMICVGTPSRPNGGLDLTQVERVCAEIGTALADHAEYHVVVVRSTMVPGSTEEVVIPVLEKMSGKLAGEGFGVCINPEFLREGSSVADFYNPPFTVVGSNDPTAAAAVAALFSHLPAEVLMLPLGVGEMVKYTSNAFHALKVAFANEIGAICKEQGIDSHEVMDVFCRDTKLNISTAYLRPGPAFGGSCLPKDLRALVHHARRHDIEAPVLEAILPSNQRHLDRAFRLISSAGSKRIGVLGLAFKAGTDDLRESPVVELIERLVGKGYQVRVFDRNVSLAHLHGANREYIEREIPHIASLMCARVDDVLEQSDVIVVGNQAPEFADAMDRVNGHHSVVDLVRIARSGLGDFAYEGIGW